MGTMPNIMQRMTLDQVGQDPLYNSSGSDFTGIMVAAQRRREEEEERRKKEEEAQKALQARIEQARQQRQQEMAPLQQPLEQMIQNRQQQERVGSARTTIIELLRAAAQGKDYKPITDKIREEETKTHAANMAQMKAMDLEGRLSQKEEELAMRNQWEGQRRESERLRMAGQQDTAFRLAAARVEATRLSKEGKLGAAEVTAMGKTYGLSPEEAAQISSGVGMQDPKNPHAVILNPNVTDENYAKYAKLRRTMGLVKGGENSRQVVGTESTGGTTQDAAGNTSRWGSSRRIYAPGGGQSDPYGDTLATLRGQMPGAQAPGIMDRMQVGQIGAAAAPKQGRGTAKLQSTMNAAQYDPNGLGPIFDEMKWRSTTPMGPYGPDGRVDQARLGQGVSRLGSKQIQKWQEDTRLGNEYSGSMAGITAKMGDNYISGALERAMFNAKNENPLMRVLASLTNKKVEGLQAKGLANDQDWLALKNVTDENNMTRAKKMQDVGGKTLTVSEQEIVKEFWPAMNNPSPEAALKAYAAFTYMLKSASWRGEYNLDNGQSFELIRRVPNYINKMVDAITDAKTKGNEAGAKALLNQLLDVDNYYSTRAREEYNKFKKKQQPPQEVGADGVILLPSRRGR